MERTHDPRGPLSAYGSNAKTPARSWRKNSKAARSERLFATNLTRQLEPVDRADRSVSALVHTRDSEVHPSRVYALKHFFGRPSVALGDAELLERFRPPCTRDRKGFYVECQDLTQLCGHFIRAYHPQQFRNVFFGPENRNGVRAGQYINDIGTPLFGRFVQLFFDVAKDEGLPSRKDIVVAHTWWYTIFGLATLFVIQGVVPGLSDQTLVIEQTIATLWSGVRAVPRLPKSAIPKRSGRSRASKQ